MVAERTVGKGFPCSDDRTVWRGKLKEGRTVRDEGPGKPWP